MDKRCLQRVNFVNMNRMFWHISKYFLFFFLPEVQVNFPGTHYGKAGQAFICKFHKRVRFLNDNSPWTLPVYLLMLNLQQVISFSSLPPLVLVFMESCACGSWPTPQKSAFACQSTWLRGREWFSCVQFLWVYKELIFHLFYLNGNSQIHICWIGNQKTCRVI